MQPARPTPRRIDCRFNAHLIHAHLDHIIRDLHSFPRDCRAALTKPEPVAQFGTTFALSFARRAHEVALIFPTLALRLADWRSADGNVSHVSHSVSHGLLANNVPLNGIA
jgi:hypothetical protein